MKYALGFFGGVALTLGVLTVADAVTWNNLLTKGEEGEKGGEMPRAKEAPSNAGIGEILHI